VTLSESSEIQGNAAISIDAFLKSVELKAYRIVILSVRSHADALDILQDSMLKLVVNYADKPEREWKPLFYRILQNRIKDWHRQKTLRSVFVFWQSQDDREQAIDVAAPLLSMDAEPESAHMKQDQQEHVIAALINLPEKQRQCFLMRTWEGMSVRDTAKAMGCSEGSVKTHFFRAMTKLRQVLGEVHEVKI